jgi:hypothetical protein
MKDETKFWNFCSNIILAPTHVVLSSANLSCQWCPIHRTLLGTIVGIYYLTTVLYDYKENEFRILRL